MRHRLRNILISAGVVITTVASLLAGAIPAAAAPAPGAVSSTAADSNGVSLTFRGKSEKAITNWSKAVVRLPFGMDWTTTPSNSIPFVFTLGEGATAKVNRVPGTYIKRTGTDAKGITSFEVPVPYDVPAGMTWNAKLYSIKNAATGQAKPSITMPDGSVSDITYAVTPPAPMGSAALTTTSNKAGADGAKYTLTGTLPANAAIEGGASTAVAGASLFTVTFPSGFKWATEKPVDTMIRMTNLTTNKSETLTSQYSRVSETATNGATAYSFPAVVDVAPGQSFSVEMYSVRNPDKPSVYNIQAKASTTAFVGLSQAIDGASTKSFTFSRTSDYAGAKGNIYEFRGVIPAGAESVTSTYSRNYFFFRVPNGTNLNVIRYGYKAYAWNTTRAAETPAQMAVDGLALVGSTSTTNTYRVDFGSMQFKSGDAFTVRVSGIDNPANSGDFPVSAWWNFTPTPVIFLAKTVEMQAVGTLANYSSTTGSITRYRWSGTMPPNTGLVAYGKTPGASTPEASGAIYIKLPPGSAWPRDNVNTSAFWPVEVRLPGQKDPILGQGPGWIANNSVTKVASDNSGTTYRIYLEKVDIPAGQPFTVDFYGITNPASPSGIGATLWSTGTGAVSGPPILAQQSLNGTLSPSSEALGATGVDYEFSGVATSGQAVNALNRDSSFSTYTPWRSWFQLELPAGSIWDYQKDDACALYMRNESTGEETNCDGSGAISSLYPGQWVSTYVQKTTTTSGSTIYRWPSAITVADGERYTIRMSGINNPLVDTAVVKFSSSSGLPVQFGDSGIQSRSVSKGIAVGPAPTIRRFSPKQIFTIVGGVRVNDSRPNMVTTYSWDLKAPSNAALVGRKRLTNRAWLRITLPEQASVEGNARIYITPAVGSGGRGQEVAVNDYYNVKRAVNANSSIQLQVALSDAYIPRNSGFTISISGVKNNNRGTKTFASFATELTSSTTASNAAIEVAPFERYSHSLSLSPIPAGTAVTLTVTVQNLEADNDAKAIDDITFEVPAGMVLRPSDANNTRIGCSATAEDVTKTSVVKCAIGNSSSVPLLRKAGSAGDARSLVFSVVTSEKSPTSYGVPVKRFGAQVYGAINFPVVAGTSQQQPKEVVEFVSRWKNEGFAETYEGEYFDTARLGDAKDSIKDVVLAYKKCGLADSSVESLSQLGFTHETDGQWTISSLVDSTGKAVALTRIQIDHIQSAQHEASIGIESAKDLSGQMAAMSRFMNVLDRVFAAADIVKDAHNENIASCAVALDAIEFGVGKTPPGAVAVFAYELVQSLSDYMRSNTISNLAFAIQQKQCFFLVGGKSGTGAFSKTWSPGTDLNALPVKGWKPVPITCSG